MRQKTLRRNELGIVVWLRNEAESLNDVGRRQRMDQVRKALGFRADPSAGNIDWKATSKLEGKDPVVELLLPMVDPESNLASLGISAFTPPFLNDIVPPKANPRPERSPEPSPSLPSSGQAPQRPSLSSNGGSSDSDASKDHSGIPSEYFYQEGPGSSIQMCFEDGRGSSGNEPSRQSDPQDPAYRSPTLPNRPLEVRPDIKMDEFTRLCFQNPLNCSINATGLQHVTHHGLRTDRGRTRVVPRQVNTSSTQETVQRTMSNGNEPKNSDKNAASKSKKKTDNATRLKNISLMDIALDEKKAATINENELLMDVQANLKARIDKLFYCPRAEDILLRDYLKDALAELQETGDIKDLTLDIFCDQYQFITRQKFGRRDFAELLRTLMAEVGPAPPKPS